MEINLGKKKIKVDLKTCNCFEKFSGLMFARREKAKALLFDFKKPVKTAIHSYFVFFPFVAIWLDKENNTVELKIVKPFTSLIRPQKFFYKLVEIPINKNYKEIMKIVVDKRKI
ncbi:DUF192 domain-containing protein [Candidatus Pacearchaeota archaeon]|nr:DUF192 domain-containing protein [Candidatus Pacearchaeota archaeon]